MSLPTVNLGAIRTVAPHVSLGRTRPELVAPRLAPRTSSEIAAEREAAVAERQALEASRTDMLLRGTAEDVANLDHRIAVAKIRADQGEVQHAAALKAEAAQRAEHEAEQARRRELHLKAMKASAEVARLADGCDTEARRLVPLLTKIRERAALIATANAALPDGAEPVPPGEPRCSFGGRPDQPHSSIADRVRLPALGTDAGFIWGEPVPLSGRIVHEPH